MAAGKEREGARGLLDLVAARRRTGFLALDWVRAGTVNDALIDAGVAPARGRLLRACLRLATLARRIRAPHQRQAGQEGEAPEAAAWRSNWCTTRDCRAHGDPRAPLDFLALEHSGWKGRAGTAMRFAASDHAQWMDSCAAPDAEMINRSWPGRTALNTLIMPADGPSAPTIRTSVGLVRAVRRVRTS